MSAVFKREFLSYFRSPVGYVAIALFSFLSGFQFINMFSKGYISLSSEIISLSSFFIIIVPIISMGLLAEDKKRGTEILFYTTPVNLFDVVFGKFLAAYALFAIMYFNVIIHMIITVACKGKVDSGVFGATLVFFFLAALYISIGLFASSISDSQVVSAIVSFVILLITQLLTTFSTLIQSATSAMLAGSIMKNDPSNAQKTAEALGNAVKWLDPLSKTQDFRYGVFSVFPLIFCISGALVFIYLTFRKLDKKRWSQK